eukprot:scaffold266884_cov33-Tisochrysis_lutea.AAC.1
MHILLSRSKRNGSAQGFHDQHASTVCDADLDPLRPEVARARLSAQLLPPQIAGCHLAPSWHANATMRTLQLRGLAWVSAFALARSGTSRAVCTHPPRMCAANVERVYFLAGAPAIVE